MTPAQDDADTGERLVRIASFQHPHEARLLASRLEAAGIFVAVQDEHAGWPECGGVKVLVPESDVAESQRILRGR